MTVAIACKAETSPYLTRKIRFAVGMFFAGVMPYEPASADPDDAVRAYSGYSARVPGQLWVEISRGDWLVIQADTAIIFDAEPRKL